MSNGRSRKIKIIDSGDEQQKLNKIKSNASQKTEEMQEVEVLKNVE